MKKILVLCLLLFGANAYATEETLTHFGISVMRMPVVKMVQVNGALMPSVEREMIPYSDWQKRLYGYVGLDTDADYGFGLGYYLGRVGMVGIQAGILNQKDEDKDEFVYGLYLDFNVFKVATKRLIETLR